MHVTAKFTFTLRAWSAISLKESADGRFSYLQKRDLGRKGLPANLVSPLGQ